MPIIQSNYKPSLLFKSCHFNTVYKTLFYKGSIKYSRVRIDMPDNDFLDLDVSFKGSDTLVIAMHGLEGSSTSNYIVSVANYLNLNNIDCVSVNFRGCSDEDNRQPYSYHSGKTDDLSVVIHYITDNYNYKNIILLGYSMGGNITLKYLGETAQVPALIKGAIAISAPCDLEGSSGALANWENTAYIKRFMKSLKTKSIAKAKKFPKSNLNVDTILKANSFKDFDDAVTAPLFGYENAEDYWKQCSSKPFLKEITRPTLLLNAKDDTFLSESCYPFKEAEKHKFLTLEVPKYGGHVGFNTTILGNDNLWSEKRIFDFIKYII